MGYLDTKKLLRQCQKIAAKQKAEQEPQAQAHITEKPIAKYEDVNIRPDIGEESKTMDALSVEQYLTEFLQFMRESNKRYDAAVLAEAEPNSATQDILHAIEFAPSTVDFESLIPTLHKLRTDRRSTKKELEVTTKIKDWYNANEKCLNQLMNVLGDIRKIIDRQHLDAYCWKTDILGEKGQWLVADPVEEENPLSDEIEGQLTLTENVI